MTENEELLERIEKLEGELDHARMLSYMRGLCLLNENCTEELLNNPECTNTDFQLHREIIMLRNTLKILVGEIVKASNQLTDINVNNYDEEELLELQQGSVAAYEILQTAIKELPKL